MTGQVREAPLLDVLMRLCETMVAASGGRLRIAKNEADATTDFDPEAQEHLKLDGRRIGRDIRLYNFMAEVGGTGPAIADFALILMSIKQILPAAFEAVRADVIALDVWFDESNREGWRGLWQ